jgi:hypothetical protein
MPPKKKDWVGEKVGNQEILDKRTVKRPYGTVLEYLCRCACGTESWRHESTIWKPRKAGHGCYACAMKATKPERSKWMRDMLPLSKASRRPE